MRDVVYTAKHNLSCIINKVLDTKCTDHAFPTIHYR